ncbi:MAG: bifunctional glutamate N-acetyltransferase/amino-acid acetyltransferase ArgJ [Oscillospiraceae bacterium]|nr:bifunctional glutamate N-acetyltransferase/amino-acid acetyltransferase ArgJ [Oscillospiraceae bacterium]
MDIKEISGGICAAEGFKAAGIHCGIKKDPEKKDLALILSEKKASCAAVYTLNFVKGAPLIVTKANIADGYAKAIICNSGNANTCNADGVKVAEGMCEDVAAALGISAGDVVVASTGVIGKPLDINVIKSGIPKLIKSLGRDGDGAAAAIMTTDIIKKELAVSFKCGGKICKLGGIAKGSGMIHPDMATLLVFITTDAAISPNMLHIALSEDVKTGFNMISVDGDTSTNDMVVVLANGMASNPEITADGEDFEVFRAALGKVTSELCKLIAKDGEGATKLIECSVKGALTDKDARAVARTVVSSPLVKTAVFGADANWGRVLCAAGYSGADADPFKIDVAFASAAGTVEVCKSGFGLPFSEEDAKKTLSDNEIRIEIDLNSGKGSARAYGCDLTYDYVRINGDYRS